MRWLHYLAFGVAFLGAQACSNDPPAPPPFKDDTTMHAGQASSDGSGDTGDGTDETGGSDTSGSDDPGGLTPTPGDPLDPNACSVTFAKDILPKITAQWRCGASACHGTPTVNTPVMATTDADATYTLLTTTVVQGKKLVNTASTNANDSALYCMMQGTCGARMPQQGVDALDLSLVKSWLECKAPRGGQ